MNIDALFSEIGHIEVGSDTVVSAMTPHGSYTFDIAGIRMVDEEVVLVLSPREKETT